MEITMSADREELSMGYLGSKAASGAFQAIIALMPPHDTYIELFAGSGAVLRRKPPAAYSMAVDLNLEALRALKDARCPNLQTFCMDALLFLAWSQSLRKGRVLIYADPPYLHSTRSSRHRYQHEMTDWQHDNLLRQFRELSANIILSGYPNALYDELLPDWNTREFQVMSRGGPRTEKLWFNFEPSAVHWASYAGNNFTDRQRIKRKAKRWAENYRALPAGEQLAILAVWAALMAEESQA
jgi:DNA adenine methylase